jgi:hypothetical protein
MEDQIIMDFNDVLLSLAQNIADVCPNSIIGTHIRDIEKAFRNRENFKEFINAFCLKVLQYKDKIDNGDESFFLGNKFKKNLKKTEDTSVLTHIFSFETIWAELKYDNKQIVIKSMQILCELAQNYFDIIYIKK